MEFIRPRWKLVGEGTQESPHAGSGKARPGAEIAKEQVREQAGPKDEDSPWECAGTKPAPPREVERLLGETGGMAENQCRPPFQRDQEERMQ